MNIVRFDPFLGLDTVYGRLNRLFEGGLATPRVLDTETAWMPAVDIIEEEKGIVLKAELPDVDEKDIEVKVENNLLTLRGEKKLEHEEKKDNYHLLESTYGSFSRAFTLPGYVDQEHIKAEYDKGVLRLTLPKKEETKPKKIEIKPSKN